MAVAIFTVDDELRARAFRRRAHLRIYWEKRLSAVQRLSRELVKRSLALQNSHATRQPRSRPTTTVHVGAMILDFYWAEFAGKLFGRTDFKTAPRRMID